MTDPKLFRNICLLGAAVVACACEFDHNALAGRALAGGMAAWILFNLAKWVYEGWEASAIDALWQRAMAANEAAHHAVGRLRKCPPEYIAVSQRTQAALREAKCADDFLKLVPTLDLQRVRYYAKQAIAVAVKAETLADAALAEYEAALVHYDAALAEYDAGLACIETDGGAK